MVPVSVGLAPTKLKDEPAWAGGGHSCAYRLAYDKSLIPDYGINTQYSLLKSTTSPQMSAQVRLSVAKDPKCLDFFVAQPATRQPFFFLIGPAARLGLARIKHKQHKHRLFALARVSLSLPHTPTPPTQTHAISNSPTPALDDSIYLRR